MADDKQIVYWEETTKIDAVMTRLLKGSEAKCALLVDRDGHLIARHGFTQTLDTTALSALMAGSFASTNEIAKLVGEAEFSVLFHQGKKDHIHMCLVSERSILAVVFDDRTTIGMVRLYAKEAADELRRVFEEVLKQGNSEQDGLSDEFTATAEGKLDDIFQD